MALHRIIRGTKLIEDLPVCAKCDVGDHQYWDSDQKWIVGKGKGVANVVVRLKVPADSYFEASDTAKKKALNEKVVMDQICCALIRTSSSSFPITTRMARLKRPARSCWSRTAAVWITAQKSKGIQL